MYLPTVWYCVLYGTAYLPTRTVRYCVPAEAAHGAPVNNPSLQKGGGVRPSSFSADMQAPAKRHCPSKGQGKGENSRAPAMTAAQAARSPQSLRQ